MLGVVWALILIVFSSTEEEALVSLQNNFTYWVTWQDEMGEAVYL